MILRDYQQRAIDGIKAALGKHRSTICVLATGTGKTVIAAELIRLLKHGRAMFVVNRKELAAQARKKIHEVTGVMPDLEMGGSRAMAGMFQSPIVVASVQKLTAGRNGFRVMHDFDPNEFSLLMLDECFPGNVLVDGRPISSIKNGDAVNTHAGVSRVIDVFCRPTATVLKVHFSSGGSLVCTPGHPISTPGGFLAAAALTTGALVHTITHHKMFNLQKTNAGQQQALRESEMPIGTCSPIHYLNAQEAWGTNYEVSQNEWNAQPGNAGEGIHQTSRHGVEADSAQREWTRPNDSRTGYCGGTRLGMRGSGKYQKEESISKLLQNRRSECCTKDWNRSRRELPRGVFQKNSRPEKGRLLSFDRVENVEVHQRGSSKQFGRLCPEGLVYNLHVERDQTYFANGVLVHNCHHSVSNSWKSVVDHFKKNHKLRIVGFTATPDRHDEKAMGMVYESAALDPPYDICPAIADGWLVPVKQQFIKVPVNLDGVHVTLGDLNPKQLREAMQTPGALAQIVSDSIRYAGDRRTLVFSDSIENARTMTVEYNRHKMGCANLITGETEDGVRDSLISAYRNGDYQFLVNVGIATEGFDVAEIACIVMARPTLSRSLCTQMAGRGTRTLPGVVDGPPTPAERIAAIAASGKPDLLLLDVVGNSSKHKLVCALDILGGKYTDDMKRRAEKLVRESAVPLDVAAALEQAKADVRNEQLRKLAEARGRAELQTKSESEEVDPFWSMDCLAVQERIRRDLCTPKMAKTLRRFGYDPLEMSMTEAHRTLDKLASNGWRRVSRVAVG